MPLFGIVAKSIAKATKGHGIGRQKNAKIFGLGLDDIKAVEALLGQKQFMLGEKPAEVDATVFALLSGMHAEIFSIHSNAISPKAKR